MREMVTEDEVEKNEEFRGGGSLLLGLEGRRARSTAAGLRRPRVEARQSKIKKRLCGDVR